jgi:hypothetical protein
MAIPVIVGLGAHAGPREVGEHGEGSTDRAGAWARSINP